MGSKRRKCKICGKMYDYCPHCAEYAGEPSWKSVYCGEECKDIYYVINKYAFNVFSKEEAKTALDELNVSKVVNNEIKKVVDDIYFIPEVVISETTEEEKPVVKTTTRKRKKKPVEPVVEEETQEIETDNNIDE